MPEIKIKGLKGDKGDPGESPSEEKIVELIKPLIPEPIKGDKGEDGKTPTEEELKQIIVPLIPDPIPGKDGTDGIDGETPVIDYEKIVKKTLKEIPKIEVEEKINIKIEKVEKKLKKEIDKNLLWLNGNKAFTDLTDTPDTYSGQGGKAVYVKSDETGLQFQVAVSSDEQVKVSSNDTTAGYLNGKLVAGTGITLVEGNDGGDETLTVNSTATESDTLQTVTDRGATTTVESTFSSGIKTTQVKANSSAGVLVEANNGTDIGLLGAGNTANVTWYGNHNFDAQTADTIASFGSSKTLQSLSTATYPSLAELAYVKGVTSAIQTQLDTKTSGSGTANYVAYWSSTSALTGDKFNYWTGSRLDVTSTLSSELVTNGTFTGSASSWTLASGWAYASNAVSHTSNGTGTLSQNLTGTIGDEYEVSFTISNWTVGSVTPSFCGVSLTTRSANGTYTERIVATTTGAITFTPTNTARFTIDDVSVKRLTGGTVRTGEVVTWVNTSNSTPSTTRSETFHNSGSNTWIDFRFSGTLKEAIGTNSNGEMNFYSSGGSYFSFYSGNSGLTSVSQFAYLYPTALIHNTGYGAFGTGINAGGISANTSTLQSQGGLALKVKRITASQTLDNTATHWLCDGQTLSCSGTATVDCDTYTDQSSCEARDAHGGCEWDSQSCSDFDGTDSTTCESGHTGCTWQPTSCSGAEDQTTCEAQDDTYGGSCSWDEIIADCSDFNSDETTCGTTSGCTQNYSNCSDYQNNAGCSSTPAGCSATSNSCSTYNGDETNCNANGCYYDSGSTECWEKCNGTYFTGCSGTYGTGDYNCNGSYYAGICSGTWGICFGTQDCIGIYDETKCNNETGCNWNATVNLTLPDINAYPDRTYFIQNDSSTDVDVVIYPATTVGPASTVNHSSSYTLSKYKDAIHIAPYADLQDCSDFDATDQSTCETNHAGCSWSDPTCSGIYYASKDWAIYSDGREIPYPASIGGTGFSSYTIGDILYANTTSTLAKLSTTGTGYYLRATSVGGAPTWSSLVLPNSASQGDLYYSSASNVMTTLAKNTSATRYLSNTGTSNNPAWAQINLSNGTTGLLPVASLDISSNGKILTANAGVASWSTYVLPSSIAQGDILVATSTTNLASLGKDTNATRYLSNTGTSNNPAWAQINLANGVTGTLSASNGGTGGTLPVGNGGTGMSSYTQGDIFYASASNVISVLAKNTTSSRYLSNTGTSNNPQWNAVSLDDGVTGTLPLIRGGTAVSSATQTYTPTLTNTTNIDASTARQCTYFRIGNVVTVAGQFDVDPTGAGATLLGISLPVASNFSTAYQLGGVASATGIAGQVAGIEADPTNDRASVKWVAVDTTNQTMTFTFTYQVI